MSKSSRSASSYSEEIYSENNAENSEENKDHIFSAVSEAAKLRVAEKNKKINKTNCRKLSIKPKKFKKSKNHHLK